MLSVDFFSKILSATQSEHQTVWIQFRTDILSVLNWVQAVCKGQKGQKSPLAGKELKRYLNGTRYCDLLNQENGCIHKTSAI